MRGAWADPPPGDCLSRHQCRREPDRRGDDRPPGRSQRHSARRQRPGRQHSRGGAALDQPGRSRPRRRRRVRTLHDACGPRRRLLRRLPLRAGRQVCHGCAGAGRLRPEPVPLRRPLESLRRGAPGRRVRRGRRARPARLLARRGPGRHAGQPRVPPASRRRDGLLRGQPGWARGGRLYGTS